MAATPADTHHEITRLRGDMNAALDEMQRRFSGGVRSVAATEARLASGRATESAVQQARDNAGLVGVGVVLVGGAITYGLVSGVRRLTHREPPPSRLKRGLTRMGAGLQGRVSERVEGSRRQLERTLPRGVLLKLEPEHDGFVRLTDARWEPPKQKGKSTVIKKLLWALMVSVFVAVGSVVARRIADTAWKAMVHENPPEART
jgi:hypothetical protein